MMDFRLVRAAAAAALLAVSAQSAAAGSETLSKALAPAALEAAAAVDAFHAALRRGDTRAAAALLTDDALVFEEGRAERSKAEYSARHLGADSEFSKAVAAEAVRRHGDASGDFAWIATEGRAKGSFRGNPVNRVTDETMVLRRIGGAWKIVHIHWSSAASSVE
ncbi:MAG TPA: nuclear transport factor 2 family protein [Allosphingosinicella sp.]|jgi:ketosteroid isomerase-like protein